MLKICQNVKSRQYVHGPALCRYFSDQTLAETKALAESKPDVCIISQSTLKKKYRKTSKAKALRDAVKQRANSDLSLKMHIPFSKRLKNNIFKRELLKGNWIELPENVTYTSVPPPNHVQVPTLAHGLEKVLFNPGVHFLQDPETKLYNFTSYLENITQPVDFDYDSLQPYITSSKDTSLVDLARKLQKRYIGSTSSVSATLSHFYFVMSNFKLVETSCLSYAFKNESKQFTRGSRTPASIYLRWKDGVYAVDADKSYDVDETILSVLGKSLEKVLTSEPDEFEKHLKENSSQLTEEEKNQPESYAYGECGKFLLRSQLDCYDPKLPRGTFDLKTRAAMPVRLDIQNYAASSAFCLYRSKGLYESFEREYYDMIRSAFLKYSFQVRIGHMDGILVAYHNTSKIFGFQYISREEMDSRLFGSSKIGDQVFRNALVMFESILDRATEKYPQQTLRLSFDTRKQSQSNNATTYIFVEAVPDAAANTEATNTITENQYDPYDNLTMYSLQTRSLVNNEAVHGPLHFKNPHIDTWSVHTKIEEMFQDNYDKKKQRFIQMRKFQASVFLPSTKQNPLIDLFKRMSQKGLKNETQ
ncbi:hypothetical protein [Parasitella parasitica]|uniref:Pet127-domain-containing protein n=1 Tax=Parasitella parasitica TaxID=35722 RepID=A0A0B7NGE8_9FUNG|nr:hypothetical protein [Parasitella parasitica]